MERGFELLDHTADVKVRVLAPSLPDLVRRATEGLYAVIGRLAPGAEPRPEAYDLRDADAGCLLRDYLAELVVLFETQRRMLTDVQVDAFGEGRLAVRGTSRLLDEARSHLQREVKAITYHELQIRSRADGYEAVFIVDI